METSDLRRRERHSVRVGSWESNDAKSSAEEGTPKPAAPLHLFIYLFL